MISFVILLLVCLSYAKQPNILVIIADDVGHNDVSFFGSNQIPTPEIDSLAWNGMTLTRHYSQPTCTPSRAAFLTGRYPIRTGMQGIPLRPGQLKALPTDVETLAQSLQKLNYSTHLVGKWHLGHERSSETPTYRGFDTHYGYWSGFIGYFDHKISESGMNGLDFHRNLIPDPDSSGLYATELFANETVNIINNHDVSKPMFLMLAHLAAHTGHGGTELETPDPNGAKSKYSYIKDTNRRYYADVLNRLDTSVGQIMKALSNKGMLDDTIILFFSDNGAQTIGQYQNYGSNWPFRGLKFTLNEGGVRTPAVIWSTKLKKKNAVDSTVIHITDWMPTLYAAAGGDVSALGNIDGVNMWPYLSEGTVVNRKNPILLNIDELMLYEGILSEDGRYKLIYGSYLFGVYGGYYGDSGRTGAEPKYDPSTILTTETNKAVSKAKGQPILTSDMITSMRAQTEVNQSNQFRNPIMPCYTFCLFDLQTDPTETTDVKLWHPMIFAHLKMHLIRYKFGLRPQGLNLIIDPRSNPDCCKGNWYTWLDRPKPDTCGSYFGFNVFCFL